ncbi:unnamed protein product [Calicophoron daubneyi]|uniref:CUB domain-containing protein n=1 Tax=Calicophoron daubneyi TaxID=300641 RepID=A0AAV2SZN9_CALDB
MPDLGCKILNANENGQLYTFISENISVTEKINCTFVIQALKDQRARLVFKNVNFGAKTQNEVNYIKLASSDDSEEEPLYTGLEPMQNKPYFSTGEFLYLSLVLDGLGENEGFTIEYSSLRYPYCGQTNLTAESREKLIELAVSNVSVNIPIDCTYDIVEPKGRKITLKFLEYGIPSYANEGANFVKFRINSTSRKYPLSKGSGTTWRSLTTPKNILHMRVHLDGQENGEGFVAVYSKGHMPAALSFALVMLPTIVFWMFSYGPANGN